jgi:periplasmic divalent cation tolerance protein
MSDAGVVMVSTAIDDKEKALSLGRMIVERHLGACVQIVSATSIYRWEGKIETADEYVLQIKTAEACAREVMEFLETEHPYDLPEIIVTPIKDGSNAYLAWVKGETAPDHSS